MNFLPNLHWLRIQWQRNVASSCLYMCQILFESSWPSPLYVVHCLLSHVRALVVVLIIVNWSQMKCLRCLIHFDSVNWVISCVMLFSSRCYHWISCMQSPAFIEPLWHLTDMILWPSNLFVIPLIEMCGCDWFKSRHVVKANMGYWPVHWSINVEKLTGKNALSKHRVEPLR